MVELRSVTIDLDDTLFPQSTWLAGAWAAVAAVAEAFGFDRVSFADSLVSFAAEGSDKGGIIDRALLVAGVDDPAPLLPALVTAFSCWAPSALPLYPSASAALVRLRSAGLRIAVITDGNPQIQRSKVAALGLDALVDHVVISDEIGGRATRKPSPAPFLRALELCGTSAEEAVHIGDRPAKDVAGAAAAGMRCIRVRTGEYAETLDGTGTRAPWGTAATFAEAVDQLLP
ncbi:MAG: putative hydrolase of the superfamily [Frankiales bacterium]|jgi:putative hydrolase of the HAD superfamily|nr:putative hydrolase of the superfamily [Frankiales bacterium]